MFNGEPFLDLVSGFSEFGAEERNDIEEHAFDTVPDVFKEFSGFVPPVFHGFPGVAEVAAENRGNHGENRLDRVPDLLEVWGDEIPDKFDGGISPFKIIGQNFHDNGENQVDGAPDGGEIRFHQIPYELNGLPCRLKIHDDEIQPGLKDDFNGFPKQFEDGFHRLKDDLDLLPDVFNRRSENLQAFLYRVAEPFAVLPEQNYGGDQSGDGDKDNADGIGVQRGVPRPLGRGGQADFSRGERHDCAHDLHCTGYGRDRSGDGEPRF